MNSDDKMCRTMSYTTMCKRAAMDVLTFNKIAPENLPYMFPQNVNTILMKDKDNIEWNFMIRRKGHIYIMAKFSLMSKYEEIYKKL